MPLIRVKVSEEELNLFKSYAKRNRCSLSEYIRTTMLEKIEDEYDLKMFEEYEKRKENGTLKTRPIEELWEALEI